MKNRDSLSLFVCAVLNLRASFLITEIFGSLLIIALMLHFQILSAVYIFERPRIMYFSGCYVIVNNPRRRLKNSGKLVRHLYIALLTIHSCFSCYFLDFSHMARKLKCCKPARCASNPKARGQPTSVHSIRDIIICVRTIINSIDTR